MRREYEIVPKGAFRILRSCAGCGRKTSYGSTGSFRVNANKNRLDVWLIYQCPKCRHTYNLPVYERVNPSQIPQEEYRLFLKNDEDAALRCGRDRRIFARSRAEIDWDAAEYELVESGFFPEEGAFAKIRNPRDVKVRPERIAAQLLGLTRSQVKRLIKCGALETLREENGNALEIRICPVKSAPDRTHSFFCKKNELEGGAGLLYDGAEGCSSADDNGELQLEKRIAAK